MTTNMLPIHCKASPILRDPWATEKVWIWPKIPIRGGYDILIHCVHLLVKQGRIFPPLIGKSFSVVYYKNQKPTMLSRLCVNFWVGGFLDSEESAFTHTGTLSQLDIHTFVSYFFVSTQLKNVKSIWTETFVSSAAHKIKIVFIIIWPLS